MQTRQKPRKALNLPGRYFTGLGSPVDVMLSDVSEGGCRFSVGSAKLAIGSPLQVYVAGSGRHRAAVRWIDDGYVGVTFAAPLASEQVANLQIGHVPDISAEAHPGEFDTMADAKPQRFC